MSLPRLLNSHCRAQFSLRHNSIAWSLSVELATYSGSCRCKSTLALAPTNLLCKEPRRDERVRDSASNSAKAPNHTKQQKYGKHQTIGASKSLFTTHPSSPGAPFIQPNGAHIFQKLISFLRAQYPHYRYQEVLTPTVFKKSLWEQSGHWANYKDDMFTVTKSSTRKHTGALNGLDNARVQETLNVPTNLHSEGYGLKPMNCPGHCLFFQSERRSYRELPIRFAGYSPLHRDEVSGALSGLTRVRHFHQDNGHIFCRPNQIREEIGKSLAFTRLVYDTLNVQDYRLVLSTRPERNYIGTRKEWDQAEEQLRLALYENIPDGWQLQKGEGAFYGPKIDTII